ncbi:DsrH/TusB family sulfur metabolism protein [Thalassolituus sp. UBA3500]|jgi:tRNA 2-thiouridine synthesizing protein B|uniref:DsrH/TusB family sulfur metabolism protein n=1 Tax=Thalassolituus sp. UBA3500 TaxID=1947664 RepID=UPI000C0E1928|nr:DsrH/TusB family sulfur metabolism protein [Thalassolituus sp. UBA3500]MBN58449.1 hypothetical protein [Oceanospirillaceae bacterium]|tara:strand:- start:236 stop:502 length:267 start_codon:yes stop_codon:yes gene_type:complete
MIVHTLFSDSPDTLSQVVAALLPGDVVLLAGDGCYQNARAKQVTPDADLFMLIEDARVRGVNDATARLISDTEWVTLTAESQQVMSWF